MAPGPFASGTSRSAAFMAESVLMAARGESIDFVLVHGTTQSPLGWSRLADILRRRGHRVAAVDLPTDQPQYVSSDYARVAQQQVAGRVADPVVVAHSGSGALLPAIARMLDARHMVWLAAFVPDVSDGHSLAAAIRARGPQMFSGEWLSMSEPPTADPLLATYFLFHDCDLVTLRWAMSTLRLFFPSAVYDEQPDDRELLAPSTYLLPTGDRTLRPEWMRATARDRLGIEPVEIDAGHCPHVSQPEVVAQILVSVAS
jgi:pimeloyl-ACP methyl ester carboxylesterase